MTPQEKGERVASLEHKIKLQLRRIEILAYLANKLKAVSECNGNMLDNTMIVYISTAAARHHGKLDSWPMVVLGGCGNKSNLPGQYIQFPGYGQDNHKTIGNWWKSILNAFRNPVEHHGDLAPRAHEGRLRSARPYP